MTFLKPSQDNYHNLSCKIKVGPSTKLRCVALFAKHDGNAADRSDDNAVDRPAGTRVCLRACSDLKNLMHATVNESAIVLVTHVPQATPTKQLPVVAPAAWSDAAALPLSARRRLESWRFAGGRALAVRDYAEISLLLTHPGYSQVLEPCICLELRRRR